MKFNSNTEYRAWAEEQDWYQTIPLSCGIKTKGNFRTDIREDFFSKFDFKGKRVLDIGCNSGQYCFMAKRMGAQEVIGVDIHKKRIEQARIINENEGLDVRFLEKGIEEISSLGKFDIVLCVAVLTETPNIIGSIQALRDSIKDIAFVEMDVARPLIYLPNLKEIFLKRKSINVFADARITKHGWMISPSMGLLKKLFGPEFRFKDMGKSVRYRMIEVRKI